MEDKWRLGRYFNFALFLFLLFGIILGNLFSSYLAFAFLFAIFIFLAYFFSRKEKLFFNEVAFFFLFICLGALLFISSDYPVKPEFLQGRPAVSLKVTSLPQKSQQRNIFFAVISNIEGHSQNLRVKVFDYGQKMEYLNRYKLKANLAKRVYQGKTFYNLWVKKDTRAQKLPLSFWEKFIKNANHYCLKVFEQNCSPAAKNFLAAIFLGRRELMGQQAIFMRKAGLAHLLAISGLHIGLLSLILFYFLRFFNFNFKSSLFISCLFLIFYAGATGLRASTQRAIIMYLIFALGFLMKRRPDLLNSLGLAGIVLLLFSPSLVYDLGFQLSFLAVLGIITGFKIFPYKNHPNFFFNYGKQIFLTSFFVFISILPLVSYNFGRIHFSGPFYNLILIPFFALILFFNFILIIVSPWAFLAKSLGAVLSWLIYFFQSLTYFLGTLSISYLSYSFTLGGLFFYYFILSVILFLVFKLKNKKTLLYNKNSA